MGTLTGSAVRGVLVAAALALLAALGAAHNGEVFKPPTPPPPPSEYQLDLDTVRIYPARWSWLHWWEANRDAYLRPVNQGPAEQGPKSNLPDAIRTKAAEALLAETKSSREQMRAAAALALGRMGEQSAYDRLAVMAAADSEEVRISALTALGLLDSEAAEKFLSTQKYSDAVTRQSAIAGLGLLTNCAPECFAGLQKIVGGPEVGEAVMAAWGLRRRTDPANSKFLATVLARTESPWLASEAILALGYQGKADAVPLLGEILMATKAAEALPVWKAFKNVREVRGDISPDRLNKEHESWKKISPNGPPLDPNTRMLRGAKSVIGLDDIYKARLRGSAAIALGLIDDPRARELLLKCLAEPDDGYNQIPKGFAIMALGRSGDPKAIPALINVITGRRSKSHREYTELTEALRGYATLALGLYIRPRPTPQGPADNPGYDKISPLLANLAADPKEALEVRAAAVLALGLTGRGEHLKLLQPISKTVKADEELLVGYMLLARGLLGDNNILEPARKFLDRANAKTDTSGLLARRAAVLGLGMLGSREAVPVIMSALFLDYHAQRELAFALSVGRAYGAAEELIKMMQTSPDPEERIYDAYCLGELFTRPRPQRCGWFLNDSNYTMKNLVLLRYQTFANQFLYNYLIPSFGDQWR